MSSLEPVCAVLSCTLMSLVILIAVEKIVNGLTE